MGGPVDSRVGMFPEVFGMADGRSESMEGRSKPWVGWRLTYDLNQLRTEPWIPKQDERRMSKMLWSMVSKAAERSRRDRHDNCCDAIVLMNECIGGPFQWNDVYSRQTRG